MSIDSSLQRPGPGVMDKLRAATQEFLPGSAYWWARRVFAAFAVPWVYSVRSGHFRSSLTGKIVDRKGRPLPWYSFPAIDFLSSVSFKGRKVLEFGSGYSTLWWAERADHIDSFESNSAWLQSMSRQVGTNVKLHPFPTNEAGRAVKLAARLKKNLGSERYDVIVIDGADRDGCAELAPSYLTPDGIVVFDNSDSWRDEKGACPILEFFRKQGFRRIDFYGLGPATLFPHCTSILFRDGAFALKGEQDTLWLKPFDTVTYHRTGLPADNSDIRE